MNIIQFFTLSELVVAGAALSLLGVCLYSWLKYDGQEGRALVLPALYFTVLYTVIYSSNDSFDDVARRFWVRVGLVALFVILIIMQWVYILRQRRKQKNRVD